MSAQHDDRPGFLGSILSGLGRLRSPGRASGHEAKADRAKPYETEDVDIGNTWLVVAGLGLTVALVIGGLAWMQHYFAAVQRAALPPLTRQQEARLDPPAPNLQADAYADAARHQAWEKTLLSTYAFTDGAGSRARIPIERAMTLTVGKSLDP